MRPLAALIACSALLGFSLEVASADPLRLRVAETVYEIDPATIEIRAQTDKGPPLPVLPALLEPDAGWRRARDGEGWRWSNGGDAIAVHADGPDLSVAITRADQSAFSARLPAVSQDAAWIIPDGEGVAFTAGDPFWRRAYRSEHCMNATAALSFPAWSVLSGDTALTIMLADGLQSELCLRDESGVQARLAHAFSPAAERMEMLIHVGPANLIAPARAYRALLERRGLFRTFADKQVPALARLYGAPHAYVWGDGRTIAFLDRLHALGVERMLIGADPDFNVGGGDAGRDYLARARSLGYLAGPYEAFENAQSPQTADSPTSNWGDELYPAGCIRRADGSIQPGFADRGCELSSEALRSRATAPNPASRYAGHVRNGVGHVFVDVDAFGHFFADFSPDHPMTMARDRDNRLQRLAIGIRDHHLVLGSEHVHAWSHGVAHYSHGSAQVYPRAIWRLHRDRERFGGWWPPERPAHFFKQIVLDADEARALFGPADQLPLFEAAFHDSVISADRWEISFMKFPGLERRRFARALLYGAPTMWALDARELDRVGPWLKAAHDAFRRAHGWDAPVALTGFAWLTPDRLVQQTTFADGREIVANFSAARWRDLDSNCVRVTWPGRDAFVLCPPDASPSP